MKIAVIADTHDNLNTIREAVRMANEERCECFLHLGDVVAPFAAVKWKEFRGRVHAIFGNNDGDAAGLRRAFASFGGDISHPPLRLELGGRRIMMMHDPVRLEESAAAGEFDYIFYGHLHHADFRKAGDTFILNPGDGGGWLEQPAFTIIETITDLFVTIRLCSCSSCL